MNKREEIKLLIEDALRDLTQTTVAELKNIESLVHEARTEERDVAYKTYNEIEVKLQSIPEYREAKIKENEAEDLVRDLRAKYRVKYEKEDELRMEELTKHWAGALWDINTAKARKQQMLRSKQPKGKTGAV